MGGVSNYSEQIFESIKHINEYGQEFWYARDLQVALELSEGQKRLAVRAEMKRHNKQLEKEHKELPR